MSATAAKLPIDIRQLPWIKPLTADQAHAFARVADFFSGDPADPAAWRDAIARAQAHPRDRDAIATILANQQERRQAPPEARAAARLLADPRTVAVVTGQQAGLFGGPLFTLLKALTTVRLAARVRDEHGVPAIALFWVEGEDHDWDEVRGCHVLDADLAIKAADAGEPVGANTESVARVRLDAAIADALTALEAALPQTEFTPDLLASLRRIYVEGRGMADAFATWLETVLGPHGLVVYDAADPAAKPLAADLFVREIDGAGATSRLVADAAARLEARGYHAQVVPQEGSLALFHLTGGRAPIRVDGSNVIVGDRTESAATLRELARTQPGQFSPNVLLRPLVQDTLFPTVCYVAGPSEIAYLAQLRGVYDAFGVPMPLVQQRATATLVDSNAMRFLSRHELPLAALQAQDEAALNQLLAAQLPASVDASLESARRALDDSMAAVAMEVPQIDPTLEGATRSALGRMQDDLKKLQGKIIQAAKRKDDTLRRQFTHAQAQVFPAGHPQERQIGFVYFLDKYGPSLVERLLDELPPEMGTHWVMTI